jgi:hypothetical protein
MYKVRKLFDYIGQLQRRWSHRLWTGRGDEVWFLPVGTVNKGMSFLIATVLLFVTGGRWNCSKIWPFTGLQYSIKFLSLSTSTSMFL